jgi:hypothetical protein
VSLATGTAADAFVPSDEEQRIRETVATIVNRSGSSTRVPRSPRSRPTKPARSPRSPESI